MRISNRLLSAMCDTSHVIALMAKTALDIEEIFDATASCSPIGAPHCFLSFAHVRATHRHHLLMPVTAAGRLRRPELSVRSANFNPWPSPRMIFSLGTLTLLNLITPFWIAFRPMNLQR